MIEAARKLPLVAPAPQVTENLYYPSTSGHIFSGPTVLNATMQLPFYGIVSLSLDGNPITVTSGGRTYEGEALVICARDLRFTAAGTQFVSIVVNPLHHHFRAFSRLESAALPLERSIFRSLDPLMNNAMRGALTHDEAIRLFDGVQMIVRPFLPAVPKLDERAQVLVKALWANPRCTVNDLAQRLGLSYHRTSHYFTEAVGIPMRTYQLWQKLYKAGGPLLAGASLTEAAHAAGFVDSAHYSSAFQKAYGRPPSEMFKTRRVTIYSTNPICKARGAPDPLNS